MSRKIAHYGESDYSNVAVATLCKSFTVVDIFLQILREFRNNFVKKNLSKAAPAGFLLMRIKYFDLKSPIKFA